MKNYLLLVFLLAFFIRLIALDQSLWLDEATTAKVVREYEFSRIVNEFSPNDFHPPLYYLLMKFWTGIFGYSEISLRAPSVLFSLLTGYLVYLLGKKIVNEKIGLWSSIFFVFNPLIVYYSQEARMYMMATFLLTVAMYFFIKMLPSQKSIPSTRDKSQNWGSLILFNTFYALAFFTFYGSIFLIIPMLLYLVYKKQYKSFLFSMFYLLFSILILSPLLFQQFNNAQKSLTIVLNWQSVLGTASIKNLLLIPLKFSFGRITFEPKWVYWGTAGTWGVFIWFLVLREMIKNKLFGYLLICPLVIGLLFSFFSPLLQHFRFLYLIPIMTILLALAIKTPMNRFIIISGFILLSLIYLLNPTFHREDWKSLAKSSPFKKETYIILPSADALKYYDKEIKLYELRTIGNVKQKQIIVIPYTADIYGYDYKKVLEEKNYYLVEKKIFRNLVVERWSSY